MVFSLRWLNDLSASGASSRQRSCGRRVPLLSSRPSPPAVDGRRREPRVVADTYAGSRSPARVARPGGTSPASRSSGWSDGARTRVEGEAWPSRARAATSTFGSVPIDEDRTQRLLAKREDSLEIAPHERAGDKRGARDVLDVIDHARAGGNRLERVFM